MTTTAFDLDKMFGETVPTDEQKEKIEIVRAAAKVFARVVLENVPESYVRRTVIDEIKRCVNASAAQITNNT
jgi:hypothetical protein